MRRVITAAAAAIALAPLGAAAQSDSTIEIPAPLCWTGRPKPRCRAFVVTEMTGEYAFATTHTEYTLTFGPRVETQSRVDESSQLLWTIGPMFNTSPSRALGVTLSGGIVNEGGREALELRHRRWLDARKSLDFSVGALRMDVPKSPTHPTGAGYGLTAGAYILGNDLVQLNAHGDVLFTDGRIRGGSTVGGGLGGAGAVGATVLLAALAVAVAIEVARSGF